MITGDSIRAARKEKGWSQKELGERVGQAQPQIARWECGIVAPGPANAALLASVLGLDAGPKTAWSERLTPYYPGDIAREASLPIDIPVTLDVSNSAGKLETEGAACAIPAPPTKSETPLILNLAAGRVSFDDLRAKTLPDQEVRNETADWARGLQDCDHCE